MTKLTNCNACGKQVSKQAVMCPECAHPIEKIQKEKNNMVQSFLLIGVLILVMLLYKYELFGDLIDFILQK